MAQQIAIATDLSSSLRRALALIETAQPGEKPEISSAMASEVNSALVAAEQALERAPRDTIERWLEALGVLVAGNPGEADAARKVRAYAAMLDYPPGAFTRRSLDTAARRFKFWPAYAELCEHLEAEIADFKRLRHQLRRMRALPTRRDEVVRRYRDLTDDERAQFEALMAPWRQHAEAENTTAGT